MIGKFKAVALATVSILAIGAVAATAAQAEVKFTAEASPAYLEGGLSGGDVQFSIGSLIVKCKVWHFQKTVVIGSNKQTFPSEYTECTEAGLPATVTMNGCDWVYYPDTKEWFYSGCPTGKKIELHVYSSQMAHETKAKAICTGSLPEQGGHTTVEYKDVTEATPDDVTLQINVTSIKYEMEGSKILCGSGGEAGKLTAEATITAVNESGSPVGWMIG